MVSLRPRGRKPKRFYPPTSSTKRASKQIFRWRFSADWARRTATSVSSVSRLFCLLRQYLAHTHTVACTPNLPVYGKDHHDPLQNLCWESKKRIDTMAMFWNQDHGSVRHSCWIIPTIQKGDSTPQTDGLGHFPCAEVTAFCIEGSALPICPLW